MDFYHTSGDPIVQLVEEEDDIFTPSSSASHQLDATIRIEKVKMDTFTTEACASETGGSIMDL